MTRIEILKALYDARNAYIKARTDLEAKKSEIAYLNQCWKEFDLDLYSEMFS